MNVLTMPPQLGRSALSLATTNVATRSIRIDFDASVCFLMAVTTSSRSWNDCSTFEQMQRHFLKIGVSVVFFGSTVLCVHLAWLIVVCVFLLSAFPFWVLAPSIAWWTVVLHPLSTVPSIDDYFEHNVWHPVLEMLFLEQVSGIFASNLVEIDLAKIALSCHFAFDLLCYKEEVVACLCTMIHRAPLPTEFLVFLWYHCHPPVGVFGASLQMSVSHFFTSSYWSNFFSNVSVSICGFG